jgi:3-mercaptopyruvate sulfurtransferase SseA
MTDYKKALQVLLAKVEAGTATYSDFHVNCRALEGFHGRAYEAFDGDDGCMDGALALHEAVRPDEGWEVWRTGKYPGMIPGSSNFPYKAAIGYGAQITGEADNPARAWLIAILKSLIAECE